LAPPLGLTGSSGYDFGAVGRPQCGQNFEATGIDAPHPAQVIEGAAGDASPRRGSRRYRTIAMTQIPTTSKIQVMNPTIPKMRTRERKPPRPEKKPENGLLELFELPPLPLFEEVTSTPAGLLVVWFPCASVTLTWTS
jgi:hypothetical protein